ncbi:hypothetical protein V5O48_007027 [Marasmius crinis-equi]|uniref:Uncharacterized protein n=1 Tax=Marasmius crinis-equi TaxID=585013 RepID=A0ABR3FHT6_9AGAR
MSSVSVSTTPPPSYTSQDREKERGREDRRSVVEKEEGGVDHNGGHSPSRNSNRSVHSHSGGDDNNDQRSTKSTREKEKRRSHRSSRHHHHDEDKTPSQAGHSNRSVHGGDDDNEDKRSTKTLERRHSHRSHRSSRHYPRDEDKVASEAATLRDVTEDDLQRITRSHMRRSQFGPELLKEIAKNGLPEDYEQEGQQKFRVVTGAEARSIYNEVIKEDEERLAHRHRDITPPGHWKDHRHNPVVFAFPVHVPAPGPLRAGGRKVVDYYMSLKGKTGTHRLKGASRKNDFLEPEFLKIAQGLDEHQKKRFSRLSTSQLTSKSAEELRPPITSSQSAPPAPLSALDPKEDPFTPPKPPFLAASLRDSNPSVLSLPNLGLSLPLRVTNPDPASSSGTDSKRASIVVNSSDAKRSPKKHDDTSKASGKHMSTLEPVAERDEMPPRKHRHKHKHHHHRPRRELNSSSESISASSTSSVSSHEKKRPKDEILIVLMDSDSDNDKNSRLTRSYSTRVPTRRTSTRVSPWNAPAVTSNGEVHRYVPGLHDELNDDDEDSSEDEEDDEMPSIPIKTALQALGLHSHNNSMPNLSYPSPYISPLPQPQLPTPASLHRSLPPMSTHFQRSATLPTPASIHQSLPPTSSPYRFSAGTELYSTPQAFSTPNLPHAHSSPALGVSSPNSSYVMPWVSSLSTPLHSSPGSLPPVEHPAAGYSSPYVPQKQAPYPYTPVQVYSSPVGSLPHASPYVHMSGGSGGGNVPLPAISIYAGTPAMAPEAQLY